MFKQIVKDIEFFACEENKVKLIGWFYKFQNPKFEPSLSFFGQDHNLIYDCLVIAMKHFSDDRIANLLFHLYEFIKNKPNNQLLNYATENAEWKKNFELILRYKWDSKLVLEIPYDREKLLFLKQYSADRFQFEVINNEEYLDWLLELTED